MKKKSHSHVNKLTMYLLEFQTINTFQILQQGIKGKGKSLYNSIVDYFKKL